MFVVGLVFAQVPVPSDADGDGAAALVDFRMAPLEQAKKINGHLRHRHGAGETMTVMAWDGKGEGRHLILGRSGTDAARMTRRFARRGFHSVSWYDPPRPAGSCDSQAECEAKTDEMCEDAGHGGVKKTTVSITVHIDGSKTCSGDCSSNGAVAFVTCNPS
jgi:hypothetical protein